MTIKDFKKYINGDLSPEEMRKYSNWLSTEESKKQLSELIDQIDEQELLANETELEKKLWSKINNRLDIEEMIGEISKEHKKKQRKLDRSRGPIRAKRNGYLRVKTSLILSLLLLLSILSVVLLTDINFTEPSNEIVENQLIEKSTEKGQKLSLHLSDGTKVILNSNSSISFPGTFNGETREVEVRGEVFFDVAHDKTKPFIVQAGEVSALVLGTSFNFQYSPEKHFNRISLVTGKVQVNIENQANKFENNLDYILTPGKEIQIDNSVGKIETNNFDIERVTAWKDGTLFFENTSSKDVIHTLENWYGVDIKKIGEPSANWSLTAKFTNESLENVLQSLSHSEGIKYKINGKNVEIKF